jgi:hypothetical protein
VVTTSKDYTPDEFLNKKEFRLFSKHKDELDMEGTEVSVTRKTCTGNYLASRKEMYPIVNFENWDKAFYLSNGVIFVME